MSKSEVKSSNKKPRGRSPYPKVSTPKASTPKKSLSFSADTKPEETTDSGPKPKGIRGRGRRRKAQLELANGEELDPSNPQHAYYILIHEELKSGKPTASVKPMMSDESLTGHNVSTPVENEDGSRTSVTRELKTSEVVVNDISGEATDSAELSGGFKLVDKVTHQVLESRDVPQEEKPALVQQNEGDSPPVPNEEKPSDYWSKPKPIRGRRRKPNADVNGNEQNKVKEKTDIDVKQDVVINGGNELQPMKLVLTNGDGL